MNNIKENFQRNIVAVNRYQKVNCFPGHAALTTKHQLWFNYSRLKRKFEYEFDFMPDSYVLFEPEDSKKFKEIQVSSVIGEGQSFLSDTNPDNVWICKPTGSG